MTSPLELSLCVPEITSFSEIQEFYNNVTQFFLKFPLPFEILFAVRAKDLEGRKLLATLAEKDPRVRTVILNSPSRAKNLENLFSQATGKILVSTSLHPTVPLGEIFKMLQELYTDTSVDAVFGNRLHGKKVGVANQRPLETPIERFFHGILIEKTPWPFKDLFCPTLALKQTSFQKILPELRSRGWHWTHEVQRAVVKLKLKAVEVPVYGTPDLGAFKETIPSRLEGLRLLIFVIFRI